MRQDTKRTDRDLCRYDLARAGEIYAKHAASLETFARAKRSPRERSRRSGAAYGERGDDVDPVKPP